MRPFDLATRQRIRRRYQQLLDRDWEKLEAQQILADIYGVHPRTIRRTVNGS